MKVCKTGYEVWTVFILKGQCHEIFCFWFFSWISFPLAPEYSIKTVWIFSKIRGDIRSSKFATGVDDTGGKWKKSSIRKILIILFGHLWVVEETYILIFAFKFTFRCLQQPDIFPIICHRCHPVANLPPVSLILVAICHQCRWHGRQICRRYRWHRWQICHRCQQHKGNWWQNLLPVSLIPVANLPPVSLIPAEICHRCRWYRRQFATGVIDTGGKFASGVVDTGGAPWLANISANFRKNLKWS